MLHFVILIAGGLSREWPNYSLGAKWGPLSFLRKLHEQLASNNLHFIFFSQRFKNHFNTELNSLGLQRHIFCCTFSTDIKAPLFYNMPWYIIFLQWGGSPKSAPASVPVSKFGTHSGPSVKEFAHGRARRQDWICGNVLMPPTMKWVKRPSRRFRKCTFESLLQLSFGICK